MSKGPRWAALAALATLSAWLSRLDVASLDSKMFGSGRPPNAQLIPGLLDRDAKRIKGAKWRQGPALMEEAKRKVDPAMPPLEDRVYVVTGATRGHGVHTAARLLDAGCTVILHGKDEGRLVDYALELGKAFPDGKIDTFLCDLREPDEVKALGHLIAERHPKIHGILHNAATIDGDFTGRRCYTWNDRMETTIAVNAMAPFLLTAGLMPQLQAAGNARVMFASSPTMNGEEFLDDLKCERFWSGLHAYRLSKLSLEMVVKEMHSRYGNAPNLTFHTFNPGVANTQLMRQGTAFGSGKKRNRAERGWPMDIPSYLPVPRKQKASFFAMVDDAFQHQSGTFVSDGIEKLKAIHDAPARAKLWEEFVEFTGAEWPKVKNEVREVMNA